MAVLDAIPIIRDLRESEKLPVPPKTKDRIKRGRTQMTKSAPARNECVRFWRGNQYTYVNPDNTLIQQATSWVRGSDNSRKPAHQVRQVRNLILDIVAHEVSACTQRVPGYEVNPSSTDPDHIAAARLAEKVALYGYDKWEVKLATEDVVTWAVVADNGFAWPVFDNTVGPFIDDGEGGTIGVGEIVIRVFGPNEVYWEPGVKFERSRWHAIEQARPLDEVYELPGYVGGTLKPDASSNAIKDSFAKKDEQNLVLVTEYLERPSLKNPKGSWLVIAQDHLLVSPRAYPCVDGEGRPVDEPVLHSLGYFRDPENDRDMGLVRHLLDAQRTINDCSNKQLEWKNLALMPQWVTLPNNFGKRQRRTNEPGAIWTVQSLEGFKQLDVPQVPRDLQEIKDEAKGDMGRIAAQNDVPNQVQAGKAIATLNEQDAERRGSFIGRLAEFHSRLMRHCLYLVQRHYTEERLLKISGPFGPETIHFRGSDLESEVDVTVLPGSIEPFTRQGLMDKLEFLAKNFPGQFSFDKAMAALDGGSTDILDQEFEVQREKQQREIQKMIGLEDTLEANAPGEAFQQADVCIPIPADDDALHLDVLHQFMETEQYDNLPDPVKHVLTAHELAHQVQQRKKAAEAAQAQQDQAAQLGMQNAARPQAPPPAGPPEAPGAPMPS